MHHACMHFYYDISTDTCQKKWDKLCRWTKNNDYVSIYNRGFQKAQIKQWKWENVTNTIVNQQFLIF